MHIHTLPQWQHQHHFAQSSGEGERNTRIVIGLTFFMMVIEIVAGYAFGSMALLADGWHMGTHVTALTITVFAYIYARRHQDDPCYTFGTGKVGVLGGFASAIALAAVAMMMGIESVERLLSQQTIQATEAMQVAVIGLVVNLLSAYLLRGSHSHHHGHHEHEDELGGGHDHHEHEDDLDEDHDHDHHDHNLRAAYLHVVADAMTSLLAIFALLGARFMGWTWMDTLMGFVGAAVISVWAFGLVKDTSRILLDRGAGPDTLRKVQQAIEADADNRVTDLHVWQLGPAHWACQVSVATHYPRPPDHYKHLVAGFGIEHMSFEIIHAPGEPCLVAQQVPTAMGVAGKPTG